MKAKHRHCWHYTIFEEQIVDSKGCGAIKIWQYLEEREGRCLCCKCGKVKP